MKNTKSNVPEQGTIYNRIAGENVERIAALIDGIFAVAMTLLLLDLHVLTKEIILNEKDLRGALLALSPPPLVLYSHPPAYYRLTKPVCA